MTSGQINYHESDLAVREGDVVEYRTLVLRRWKPGRVSYVPGESEFNSNMEYDGLRWIGVSGDDGTFRGVLVSPETQHVQKTVRFKERGANDGYLRPADIAEDEW